MMPKNASMVNGISSKFVGQTEKKLVETMMLTSMVDQLTNEAQELVHKFVQIVKATQEEYASTAPRLSQQWTSVELLYLSVESAISGFGASSHVQPYVLEISKIISIVTASQLDHESESDEEYSNPAKEYQVSFPYYILKLLSSIKSCVRSFIGDYGLPNHVFSNRDSVDVSTKLSNSNEFSDESRRLYYATKIQQDSNVLDGQKNNDLVDPAVQKTKEYFKANSETKISPGRLAKKQSLNPEARSSSTAVSALMLARAYDNQQTESTSEKIIETDAISISAKDSMKHAQSSDSVQTIYKSNFEITGQQLQQPIAAHPSVTNINLVPALTSTSSFPELPVTSAFYKQYAKNGGALGIFKDMNVEKRLNDETASHSNISGENEVIPDVRKKQMSTDNLLERHGGIMNDFNRWKGNCKSKADSTPVINQPRFSALVSYQQSVEKGHDILASENVKNLNTMPLANILYVALEGSPRNPAPSEIAEDIKFDDAIISKYTDSIKESDDKEEAENFLKKISMELSKIIKPENNIPLGTDDVIYSAESTCPLSSDSEAATGKSSTKSTPGYSKSGDKMVSPFISPSGLISQFNLSNLSPLDDYHTQIVLIPLNEMFEVCYLNLSKPNLLGRSNTNKHARFKAFQTQVVSRSHLEVYEVEGKVYIKDVGSSSGSFLNGARLSDPSMPSTPFEIQSGDYIQLGKDYVNPKLRGQKQNVVNAQHRCIKMQFVIVFNKEVRAPTIRKIEQQKNCRFTSVAASEKNIHPASETKLRDLTESVPVYKVSSALKQPNLVIDTQTPKPPKESIPQIPSTSSETDSQLQSTTKTQKPSLVSNLDHEKELAEMQEKEKLLKMQKKAANNTPLRREKYMVTVTGNLAKIKKMQITSESGVPIFGISLKSWEGRR